MRPEYRNHLKPLSRRLRATLTDAESLLWYRIRRKQISGIQFYRQRPVGNFIVDFFAPRVGLVIEVDGSQHFEEVHKKKDINRDKYLKSLGLTVLRFDNRQVLMTPDSVLEEIYNVIQNKNPPHPPLKRGESA